MSNEAGSGEDRPARGPEGPGAPVDAAPAHAGDLDAVRAELAAERRSRKWLEERLEELDQRLRRAQASERALQNAAAQDQVAFLGLQSALTAETQKESDREALGMWILEAQMRADAVGMDPVTATARPEPIMTLREPAVDHRFEEKLASARMAVEAAEARAAHNAAQVRRLTEELAASRTDQTRAMNRLRDMERKLQGLEARAELLDTIASPKVAPKGTPEFELPADTMAPLSPVKPSLVFTETEAGPQLAPAAQEQEDDTQPLSLEEFEPKPYAPQSDEAKLLNEPQGDTSDGPGVELVDALEELFGGGPDTATAPTASSPAALDETRIATPRSEEIDTIAEALEMFGAGPIASAPAPLNHDDPFGELGAALESLSTGPAAPERPAVIAPAASDDPFGDLASAMESLRVESDRPQIADAPEGDPFSALAAAMESITVEHTPGEAVAAHAGENVHDASLEVEFMEPETAPADENEPATPAAPEAETCPAAPEAADAEATLIEAPAAAPPVEEAPADTEIHSGLFAAMHRVEEDRHAAQRQRPARLARQASQTGAARRGEGSKGDDDSDNGQGAAKDAKGRAAMVDALRRFMGPQ